MSLAEQLKDPSTTPDRMRASQRDLTLTRLDTIQPEPVSWLWYPRMAAGMFGLLAGREGVGKSMLTCDLTAKITRGKLDGCHRGRPRKVLICATEDSFAHTVVPRMIAANADLTKVARVDVREHETIVDLKLPVDLPQLASLITTNEIALVILDPLISRLDAKLDTHKDADVRRALEPFVKLAGDTGAALLGLIHLNKGSTTDANNLIMGSRAFSAVSRYTLHATVDPDDPKRFLLGQSKNSIGPSHGLPLLPYRIEPFQLPMSEVGSTVIETARVVFEAADDTRTLVDVLKSGSETKKPRDEAREWLEHYLETHLGPQPSSVVKAEAKKAGYSERTLKRAMKDLAVNVGRESVEGPGTTWELPPF
jgi:hypothetical protein